MPTGKVGKQVLERGDERPSPCGRDGAPVSSNLFVSLLQHGMGQQCFSAPRQIIHIHLFLAVDLFIRRCGM